MVNIISKKEYVIYQGFIQALTDLLIGGQNSILNFVLKLNPINQKIKK